MRPSARHAFGEIVRMMTSSRWVLGVVVCLLVAWLAATDVAAESLNSGLSASALDVHATAANSLAYVGYLLLATLAFITGDTVAADLGSHYARLGFTRRVSVASWWLAKAVTVVCTAVLMAALVLGSCVLVGAVQGLPVKATPSELATATAAERGFGLFPEVSAETDMWLRQIGVTLHLGLGFSALLLGAVALTAWWPSRVLPVAVLLVGLMADYVAVKAWEPWRVVSPGLRLLEGVHRQTASDPLSLPTSVAFFSVLLIAAILFGLAGLRCRDL